MFKVIVAGGREFNDMELLTQELDRLLANKLQVEIVSGGAKGADSLGEAYARLRGYPVKQFPADWDNLGKTAGPVRNGQMAEYADALVLFWDGKSRGSANMLQQANLRGLEVRIVRYD